MGKNDTDLFFRTIFGSLLPIFAVAALNNEHLYSVTMPRYNESSMCARKEFMLCECISNTIYNDEIFCLDFAWQGPAPKGGQFFLIKPERTSVFLGRPLSVAGWDAGAAGKPGILHFVIALRGRGTMELSNMKPGEKAFLTGPLGKGWAEALGEINAAKKLAFIGGGAGVAPLACYAKEPGNQNHDFYAGFRGPSFGLDGLLPLKESSPKESSPSKEPARSIIIASEDGTEGKKGRIPDYFKPDSYDAVLCCGPEPMLKAVAEKCKAASVPCFVSLERRMACGVGACLGCTVKTRDGNKRCCADGPVFNAEDIIFD